MTPTGLVERLAAHRTLAAVPRSEIEWLAAHGELRSHPAGETLRRPGEPVDDLWIVLSGCSTSACFATPAGGG